MSRKSSFILNSFRDVTNDLQKVKDELEDHKVKLAPIGIFNESTGQYEQYKFRNAVVYEKNNKPITIVSNIYKPVNHADVFNQILEDLDDSGINYTIPKINHIMSNGRDMFSSVIAFPEMKFDIDGSDMFPAIKFDNSCDGSVRFMWTLGFWRLKCSNGMAIEQQELASISSKHTHIIETPKILEQIEKIEDYRDEFSLKIENMQMIKINQIILDTFAKLHFPEMKIEKFYEEFLNYANETNEINRNPETLWSLYQYLTYWITNKIAQKSVVLENRYNRLLYNAVMAQIENYNLYS